MRKRLITFLIVAFVAYFVLTAPAEAANLVRSSVVTARGLLGGLAESLQVFFTELV